MSQKVLRISAEDAKYIDPNQVATLTMVDGSTIYVKGNEEGFVEEVQEGGEQYDQQGQQQQQQQPKLRGLGTNLALGAAALGAAALGAAAIGKAVSGPKHMRGPMMGPGMMGRPGMIGGPGMMGRPGMMGGPMRGPGMTGGPGMMGRPYGVFRARPTEAPTNNENNENICPYCNRPLQ